MGQIKDLRYYVNNAELAGALTPGAVIPGVEVIRNSERSLDGTMTVDIVAKKRTYELVYQLLSNDNYIKLMGKFPIATQVAFKELITGLNSEDMAAKYLVDSVSYKPVYYEELMWQEISIKLIEV